MGTSRNWGLLSSLADVILTAPVQGSAPLWSSTLGAFADSSRAWGIGVTSTAGLLIDNTTAAAAGAQQYSPRSGQGGCGWKTASTAASQSVRYWTEVRPVQGTTAPSGTWVLSSQIASGSLIDEFTVDSLGSATLRGTLYCASVYGTACVVAGASSSACLSMYFNYDFGAGFGACVGTWVSPAATVVQAAIHPGRTDGPNNIVFAWTYDRGATSITNADTMRLASWGWTNNSDVYAELAACYCNGMLEGAGLRAKGDIAGVATTTTITNATVSAGGTPATLGNAPAAAGAAVWIKIYVGTTAYAVPCWAAA
jgi:hypothetical protein